MRHGASGPEKGSRGQGFPGATGSRYFRLRLVRRLSETGTVSRDLEPLEEEEEGIYVISVAARMLHMHPQTLRKYERIGLVTPSRTVGMLRLYSVDDVARLGLIKHLVDDLGLNLAGVQLALELFNRILEMRAQMGALKEKEIRPFVEESLEEMFELLGIGR